MLSDTRGHGEGETEAQAPGDLLQEVMLQQVSAGLTSVTKYVPSSLHWTGGFWVHFLGWQTMPLPPSRQMQSLQSNSKCSPYCREEGGEPGREPCPPRARATPRHVGSAGSRHCAGRSPTALWEHLRPPTSQHTGWFWSRTAAFTQGQATNNTTVTCLPECPYVGQARGRQTTRVHRVNCVRETQQRRDQDRASCDRWASGVDGGRADGGMCGQTDRWWVSGWMDG